MGDIVDSENIPQAIKHLQASVDSRVAKFGDADPIVKRKLAEIEGLKARASRQATQAAPKLADAK